MKYALNIKNFLLVFVFVISILNVVCSQNEVGDQLIYEIETVAQKNGYTKRDVQELLITDRYTSRGIEHIYFTQAYQSLPIYKTNGSLHYHNGKKVYENIDFIQGLSKWKIIDEQNYKAEAAIIKLSQSKNYSFTSKPKYNRRGQVSNRFMSFAFDEISHNDVLVREVFFPYQMELRKAWEITIDAVQENDMFIAVLDGETGEILDEVSLIISCNHGNEKLCHRSENNCHQHKPTIPSISAVDSSYHVIALPKESPHNGGRTVEINPWMNNESASPNGWHSIGNTNYTVTRGNNVDAYDDSNNTNSPSNGDLDRADGGAGLDFDFPWDASGTPSSFKDAAITNVFYWSNIIHDVMVNYGFDEASGNFQSENYSQSGAGSDYVRAEAQDGSGSCNANFGTPPDGSRPRMQMYLCNSRDGDFDNGVIIHEIGHGISNRLIGGPSAVSCLSNAEQMGEGWSDYYGIMLTMTADDIVNDRRTIGTWLFGQGPNGDGIRPFPYSTDLNINPMTYTDINNHSVPHGVGSVWCTMLYEMTMGLIEEHGFDPDVYNGTGGNNIALQLVTEGMKLQACFPGFIDGRNGILKADEILYGGANQCIIWEAFAKRGLGVNAEQGDANTRNDDVESYDIPNSCKLYIEKLTPQNIVGPECEIEYDILVVNLLDSQANGVVLRDTLPNFTNFVSASDNGTLSNNEIVWPSVNLASGDTIIRHVVLEVDQSIPLTLPDYEEDMEGQDLDWVVKEVGSASWVLTNTLSFSGQQSWFAADVNTSGRADLIIGTEQAISENSVLEFVHWYDTEIEWDGGLLFISDDNGNSWSDAGELMTVNGYNNTLYNGLPGFSGNSNNWIITEVDLSSYANKNILIRFEMNCDQAVGGNGWYIDDIQISNRAVLLTNKVSINDGTTKTISRSNNSRVLGSCLSSNIVVTSNDAGSASLRELIDNACPLDTIVFDSSLDNLDINLSSGTLLIDKPIAIRGNGINATAISGSNAQSIFHVTEGGKLYLEGVKLKNANGNGGAIWNEGKLLMKNVEFEGNLSNGNEQAIENQGVLKILENVNVQD